MADMASYSCIGRKCMKEPRKERLAEQKLGSYSNSDEGINHMSSMGWLYRRIRWHRLHAYTKCDLRVISKTRQRLAYLKEIDDPANLASYRWDGRGGSSVGGHKMTHFVKCSELLPIFSLKADRACAKQLMKVKRLTIADH